MSIEGWANEHAVGPSAAHAAATRSGLNVAGKVDITSFEMAHRHCVGTVHVETDIVRDVIAIDGIDMFSLRHRCVRGTKGEIARECEAKPINTARTRRDMMHHDVAR